MKPLRLAIVAMNPWHVQFGFQPINYAAYRIKASVISDPELENVEVAIIENHGCALAEWIRQLEEFEPDIVGFSAYVWSLPTFVELARRLKLANPGLCVVFGGPSARPANLALSLYEGCTGWIDALVLSVGEYVIREIVKTIGSGVASLTTIAGLAVPDGNGWRETAEPAQLIDLNQLASPYQLGLVPAGATGSIEIFRGCPRSCSFCQWGGLTREVTVLSRENLAATLRALRKNRSTAVHLVDAGLNLHAAAWRNLLAAEEEVGFLRGIELACEVYPNLLKPEHLEFLNNTRAYVGLGVQTLDPLLLKEHGRRGSVANLNSIVEPLARVAQTSIELIMGLPGDSPEQFRRTLEEVLKLPCSTRVYHCQVLPDALLDNSPARYKLEFDPLTLEVRSCLGWSREDILRTAEYLNELVVARNGVYSRNWPHPAAELDHINELGYPLGTSLWIFTNHGHEDHHRHGRDR